MEHLQTKEQLSVSRSGGGDRGEQSTNEGSVRESRTLGEP